MKTKVGFIGFGLIAGSLAHALKESGRDYHITATSRHLEPVIAAVADGIVDVAAPAVDETFAQCDIILLCTPVITITEYLEVSRLSYMKQQIHWDLMTALLVDILWLAPKKQVMRIQVHQL